MDANNKSTQLPPATKWIQNSEDSDSDQIGLVPHNRGYKHILFFLYINRMNTNNMRLYYSLTV